MHAVHGSVIEKSELGQFHLITFNKVLEHVDEPITILSNISHLLLPDGMVYVELPDGEGAEVEGKEREEFLLGHVHIFSAVSFSLLALRSKLTLLRMERLREPSGKYTLRGIMKPNMK